jgi:hypothetical protein
MKLSSDGQTIEVFGLTSKGEKQAIEGNGVFDFPTEVDGKTKFLFKGATIFGGGTSWARYDEIKGIIFDENFQANNLSYEDRDKGAGVSAWLMFYGHQNLPLGDDIKAHFNNGFIFRDNLSSDFDDASQYSSMDRFREYVYKDNIIDSAIILNPEFAGGKLIAGTYFGQIFDIKFEDEYVEIPDGVNKIYEPQAIIYEISFGLNAVTISSIKIPSSIEYIQQNNVIDKMGIGVGDLVNRENLIRVAIYDSTVVDDGAFASNVEIIYLQ